jgi:NitT/TauT family transport system substrate-binding protein
MRAMMCAAALLLALPRLLPAELRIGLMPAENSFPLVVAAEKGYYAAEGVTVSLTLFSSQLNREAALQSGAIDGSISDLVNALQSWANGGPVMVGAASEGAFSLLVSPRSPLATLAAWKAAGPRSVRTGLLENSVVFYASERMLTRAGADPGCIELVPIVPVPVRLEMLLAGQVDACCLPEPLGTLAVSRGARRVADTQGLPATPGVMVFTRTALSAKAGEIRALLRAYNRAVEELAARPDAWRQAIVEACELPRPLAGTLVIPSYRKAFVPGPGDVADVASWMVSKGLLKSAPRYEQVVFTGLVP